MSLRRILPVLAGLLAAGVIHAELLPPGPTAVTSPAPNQVFATGTTNVPCGWAAAAGADSYELKILFNDKPFAGQSVISTTDVVLVDTFTPGYYTLFVRGSNVVGNGAWSSNVTFIVQRKMTPDSVAFSGNAPKVFKWTRTEPATRYLLKISLYDNASAKYKVVQQVWVPQPAAGLPKWSPTATVPDGKFRWSVTDYKGTNQDYTQTAYFKVKNTGITGWNDPAKIIGHWKVLSPWRWVELTFLADGSVISKQGNGDTFKRAKWYVEDGKFVMVSDVVERCPYTVTDTTFSFLLPSGNTKNLVRLP